MNKLDSLTPQDVYWNSIEVELIIFGSGHLLTSFENSKIRKGSYIKIEITKVHETISKNEIKQTKSFLFITAKMKMLSTRSANHQ